MGEQDQPTPSKWRRAAVLFKAGAVLVALITIAVLSFDAPLARRQNPEPGNAYVGAGLLNVEVVPRHHRQRGAPVGRQLQHQCRGRSSAPGNPPTCCW